MSKTTILVAGAGGIGRAVALMLAEWADFDVELLLGDVVAERADEAATWVREGNSRNVEAHGFSLPREGTNSAFDEALERSSVLLDCLPGSQAPRMARRSRENGLHYANLTEYVAETNEVRQIADGAETGFLLQTGLAPGFIDVLGHALFQRFCSEHKVKAIDTLQMRVGALPVNATPPHYYGFTWSPVGVATEYMKDAIVVRNGKRTTRPSLTDIERVNLGGLELEAALTSGGAADLPSALAGRVKTLDYKTYRHPGHYAWVKEVIQRLPYSERPIRRLEKVMLKKIPAVEQDQVITYASVEGLDHEGIRRRIDESLCIPPLQIGPHRLRAIQSTTAAGLAESCRVLLQGDHTGVILQSQIDAEVWLSGPFVRKAYYGD